jgi:phosphate transport system permease protein
VVLFQKHQIVKNRRRRYFEKFFEGILFSSSTITSITVIFIILFLFREGFGIFNTTPVDKGYVFAVNRNNPIRKISSSDINHLFNQDITNWKQLKGGNNDSIVLFTIDNISKYYSEDELGPNFEYLPQKVNELLDKNPTMLAFISQKYLPKNFSGHIIPIENIKISEFIFGKFWYPTTQPAAQFGVLPLILGTLWVSLGAILLALPLGLATAVYMAEVSNEKLRNVLKPIIELLAGIPSVVYGFFGLIVVVPLIQKTFNLPVGETALAGSIILAIMALPTIITISEDAIRTTPRSLKEASLALGATRWQTMVKVTIPYSISGITAGSILGIGRAVGETMAVLMVTGNASVIPHTFLQPVRTIPATIAAELGEAPFGGTHYKALFALGIILFFITFGINMIVELMKNKRKV